MPSKKSRRGELTSHQIAELTQAVSTPHPEALSFLVQKALDAIGSEAEGLGMSFGRDIQQTIAEQPAVLKLICALGPRDVAEAMLISQFVVLHVKGMKSFHADSNEMGMEFLKLAQETFELLNRYRGKRPHQNINVTYNVVSDKTQINALCQEGT
jgi:hypothetical protein